MKTKTFKVCARFIYTYICYTYIYICRSKLHDNKGIKSNKEGRDGSTLYIVKDPYSTYEMVPYSFKLDNPIS